MMLHAAGPSPPPLQSRESRRDIVIGGLWLLVPIVGWLMNMDHRVRVVHRLQRGEPPWPAWDNPGELLRHGAMTFAGMVWYGWPGALLAAAGAWFHLVWLTVIGLLLVALGIGFVFTSVWFWQTAAFSFATVFTQRFDLDA